MFLGANDGYPMPGPGGRQVACCGLDWAAIYANRVRALMNIYRRGGAARVYWLTLPAPRDPDRRKIWLLINAAVTVAAQPWPGQVSVLDTVSTFTPGFAYRDAMNIGGAPTIVRNSDGEHLTEPGSNLLADGVREHLGRDFQLG